MSFIRSKKINGKSYFYLVESKRIDGKVKQRVVKYIGTNKNLLLMLNVKQKKDR